MGNGMNKVLPGLYVGNYRDSKDVQQLDRYQISHIIAIHDTPRRLMPDKHYLCVMAADVPEQNLSQYFSVCNDFIHSARLRNANVLIHCLAGMSRSVTVCVAYVMTITNLNWKDALRVVRTGRAVANPNLGFQEQLQEFETMKLSEERRRLRERFPSSALEETDREKCFIALANYQALLQNRDICEGNCNRGDKCPTGVCQTEVSKGLFRRRPSTSSNRSNSRLKPIKDGAQSCPTSPRHGSYRKASRMDSTSSNAASQIPEDAELHGIPSLELRDEDKYANGSYNLQRSASTVSGISVRPRSSPAGLHSYTGRTSAPSSVHGSRVDINRDDKGSAIYLGCSAPKASSSWSINSRGSATSSASVHTPPVSPKLATKRFTQLHKVLEILDETLSDMLK